MSSRCDGVADCTDKSDEKEWDLVNIDESYDRNICNYSDLRAVVKNKNIFKSSVEPSISSNSIG